MLLTSCLHIVHFFMIAGLGTDPTPESIQYMTFRGSVFCSNEQKRPRGR
jgi:hypothetical protein